MDFSDDLENWIDFVCNCRNGSDDYLKYGIIKGMKTGGSKIEVSTTGPCGFPELILAGEGMHRPEC